MDLKQILRMLIILLIGAGFAMTTVACGDPEANNGNGDGDVTDADGDADGEADGEGDGEADGEADGDADGEGDGDLEPDLVLADPPPSCDDADRPARCDEDPTTFDDWSPASLITELKIADETCCFDFTDDGFINNDLPGIIGLFSTLGEINETLAESVADGTITLVLEHAGLTEAVDGAEFDINFLLAEAVEGGVLINPASFEEGVYPEAVLPNAKLTDDNGELIVTAGPGTVFITLELFELELELAIRNAKVEAVVVGTSEDGGVILEEGILGGVILFSDLTVAINRIASTCDCLNNPARIVETNGQCILPPAEDEEEGYVCEDQICDTLANFCSLVPTALIFAEIDTTGDGQNDAFGAGLTFEAGATLILGVDSAE